MKSVTFCAFADIHYCPGAFPHDSVDWLDRILVRASQEQVDFIIQLGDMSHQPTQDIAYINHYRNAKIKTYSALGNHDHDDDAYHDVLKAYGIPGTGYYHFDEHGFRFIVLDPNYYREAGTFVHYSLSNYYAHPDREWIPPAQLKWLGETLEQSSLPCVILSHQSFEREEGAIQNYQEIRDMLHEANARTPGKVRLCINGHHHRDHLRILDNIIYLDLNSANIDWVSKSHACFPQECYKKWANADHVISFNDPLSAIITLREDGQFILKGQSSSFFHGVSREMTGNAHADECGRPVTSAIQSATLKMDYGI